MASPLALRTARVVVLAALALGLSALTGCSSGINTMSGPSTATRMTRYSGFPIDDPAPVVPGSHMPAVVGRGYGYMGG